MDDLDDPFSAAALSHRGLDGSITAEIDLDDFVFAEEDQSFHHECRRV